MTGLTVAPRFRTSQKLENLSGETMLWIVSSNLDVRAGFTIRGGDGPDRFLSVNERLIIAPSMPELLACLPPTGRHSFDGDGHFTKFCEQVHRIELADDAGDAESGSFDFGASLVALRERRISFAPYPGMTIDCLDATSDLGWQYGLRPP